MIIFDFKNKICQEGVKFIHCSFIVFCFSHHLLTWWCFSDVWILVPESGYFIGGDWIWKYLTKFCVSSLDTLFEFVKRNLPTLPGQYLKRTAVKGLRYCHYEIEGNHGNPPSW